MWQCHLSAQDYRYYPVDGYSLLKRLPLHPPTGPRCPVQTVGQWLENIGLPQYENHLLANGFDNVQFMVRNLLCIAVYIHCSWLFVVFFFFVCLLCDHQNLKAILHCTKICVVFHFSVSS